MTMPRVLPVEERAYDVVVVGGGMAGLAAAVTAAREGATSVLLHNRPVLGGNASSEIRVNLEGANGGAHNRFFVESGLAEDLLLENFWRNPTGSADHWSAILLELVLATDGLDLLLDTHVDALDSDGDHITAARALTLGSEQRWRISGRVFVDATGDGTLAYLAGASFMRGEEARSTFDEPLAPLEATDYKLGGTMQFMCRDTGRQVLYQRPSFAREVTRHELSVSRLPNVWTQDPVLGGFWWIEYGGDLDTITDNAQIKLALLAEVFGVWDYVKNAPEWRERNANLDLEWVAAVPGKRESRRVIGDHVLTERDVMDTTIFPDAVAFGGWSIDRHPPAGFLDFDQPPAVQVHPPGVYQIPLRSLYARDVRNLFLAGRDISASHVACCTSRVMLTCLAGGEAVGVAAAFSATRREDPRTIACSPVSVREVQAKLERRGHHIPYVPLGVDRPPAGTRASASSEGELAQRSITSTIELETPRMLSLPLADGCIDALRVWLECPREVELVWRVLESDSGGRWIPGLEITAGSHRVGPTPGAWIELPLGVSGRTPGYVHVALAARGEARLGVADVRPYGPLSWRSQVRDVDAVPVDRRRQDGWGLPQQAEDDDWGDTFAFVFSYWRRDDHGWGGPPGPALAFEALPRQVAGAAAAVLEPWERPTVTGVHGWTSADRPGRRADGRFEFDEPQWLRLDFPHPVATESVEVHFNSDLDRHLANLWYSHPPGLRAMRTIVADADLEAVESDGSLSRLSEVRDNYRRRWRVKVGRRISGIRLVCRSTHGESFASIADIRVRVSS